MAESDTPPPRLSPFAALFAATDSDDDARVTIAARALGQAQIDCAPDRAAAIALPLPGAGRSVSHDGLRLLNLAPGRWMVIAAEAHGLESRVRAACGDSGAATVDQGHGRATLRLSGSAVRDALAKGTGVDLHPRAFAEDHVISTALFHVSVTIDRRRGGGTFDIHMPRGYARSLAERLIDAGRAFGVAVTV